MKLKGIGWLEQHVEKLVLVLFGAIFLVVFVLQFDVLGDPNAVEINGRKVSPDQALNVITEDARRLEAELNSGVVPSEFPASMPSVSDFIDDQIKKTGERPVSVGLGPKTTPTGEVIAQGSGTDSTGTGGEFLVPEAPAPTEVAAAVFEGSMHPIVIAEHPEVGELVGSEQPYDFAAVTVQASFDAEQFREILRPTDGAGGSATPLPGDWTRTIDLVDVILIRERQDDNGQWVDQTEIDPMPGRYSTRQMLRAETFVPANLPELYKAIAENMQAIRRPAPYDMIQGAGWVWPALANEVASVASGGGQAGRLLERKTRLQREIDDDTARIEALRERLANANDRDKARMQEQIGQLETGLEVRNEDMAELDQQLTDLGVDPATGRLIDDPRNQQFQEPLTQLMARETSSITVWAHDYSVERGQTYRYAVRLAIVNPMFGHRDSLTADQKPLADSPVLETPDSEWTGSVSVPDETYLFVADAAPPRVGAVTGPARASIEMYRFYYGYWRRARVDVSPGDAISASVSLPGLSVFEVIAPEEGAPSQAFTLGQGTPIDEELNFASGDFLIDVADMPMGVFVSRDGRVIRLPVAAGSSPLRARLSASVEDGQRAEPPASAPPVPGA